MRLFTITIGARGAPRIVLEAMAPDSFTAREQHADQALLGERVEVAPVPSEEEKRAADLAYLLNQEARERRRVSEATHLERAMDHRREWR